jgi:hypothetical protein
MTERGSVVYFLRGSVTGRIKIGWSSDLEMRITGIQTGSEPVEVLCTLPGSRTLEGHLHEKFDEHRVHGEWFNPHDEILQFVEQVNTFGPAVMAAGFGDPGVTGIPLDKKKSAVEEMRNIMRVLAAPYDCPRPAQISHAGRKIGVPYRRAKSLFYADGKVAITSEEMDRARAAYAKHRALRSDVEHVKILCEGLKELTAAISLKGASSMEEAFTCVEAAEAATIAVRESVVALMKIAKQVEGNRHDR